MFRTTQLRVPRRSLLGEFHDGPIEKTLFGRFHPSLGCHPQQSRDRAIVDEVLGQFDDQITHAKREVVDTIRIGCEEFGDRTRPFDGEHLVPRSGRLDSRHPPDASGEPEFGSAEC